MESTEKISFSKRLFSVIRQAISGGEYDYTEGSLRKAVVLLAIPMILELSFESIFALVDIFFVSGLGQNAIATVGLTESVITLVYSVAIGMSTAATAVVARRVGEKNPEGANRAAAQAILVTVSISFLLSIAGFIFAADILRLMGAAEDVVQEGVDFTQIMLGTSMVITLLFMINGIFRGAGDASISMWSLILASIINIILCPVFIHFFGLKGAAIATVIGRATGVTFQCYHLFRKKGTIQLMMNYFKPDWSAIKNLIIIAYPATIQFIIASGSWIILTRLIAETGGTTASAGYQLAIRNVIFFILPAWGLSNAAATLVGQNLGAQKPERARQSVLLATRYNAIFMSGVMLLFLFVSRPILSIFSDDEAVVSIGSKSLQIIGSAYVFYGIGMVMAQSLNGAGDTRTPTLINLFCFWMFQIPLAYWLAYGLKLGDTGAMWAIPIAETLIACLSFYFFRRGRWMEVKV